MRLVPVLVALALSVVACDRGPITSNNRAIAFITFVEPSADCLAVDTGHKGLADTAVCRAKGQLIYCAGMAGVKPVCEPYIEVTKGAPASRTTPSGPAEMSPSPPNMPPPAPRP